MTTTAHAHAHATASAATRGASWLQRKCACGSAAGLDGQCSDCGRKKSLGLQAQLAVGAPGNRYEREADQAAARVLRGAALPVAPGLSRLPAPPLQRARQPVAGPGNPAAPEAVQATLAGAGAPLAPTTRQFMETRFGHDFGRVRIHAGTSAASSAQAVGARAYTVGADIVFGRGHYVPHTDTGRHLLAHELAHVVQQGGGTRALQRAPASGVPGVPGVPGAPGAPGMPGMPPASDELEVSSKPATQPRTDPVEPPASKQDICASCVCSPEHAKALQAAREKALLVLEDEALEALKDPLKSPLRRLFEQQFGEGSATPQAVTKVRTRLQDAQKFLKGSKVWDPASGVGNIHCDPGGAAPGCATGNTAYYERGHIVVCATNKAAAQMFEPPKVPDVKRPVRTVGSTDPSQAPGSQAPGTEIETDAAATQLAQHASDAGYAAKRARVLLHEAIHHAIKPGTVDIYKDERLYSELGGKTGKHGVDLSALALRNPDSLVAFAMRAPRASNEAAIEGTDAALATSGQLSGKLRVWPLRGARRARLMVDLAQEAIEQAAKTISMLHSEVASVAATPTPWTNFSPASQEFVDWLVRLGQETALGQPDTQAERRLAKLDRQLTALLQSLRAQRVVVRRRFLLDWDARVEVAIPDWRGFREMAPAAQFAHMLRALLRTQGLPGPLADVVLKQALLHGGMDFLGKSAATPAGPGAQAPQESP